MRKVSLLLFCILAAAVSVGAQDLITKVNGEEVQAKILEVNDKSIRYKLWDYMDGPTYTMVKSKILTIRYENGYEETVRLYPVSAAMASGEISVGMKYREYRKLYDPQEYIPMYNDAYKPALAGVCSWLIPGLGQMICGEVGRGFAFFGGCVGSMYLATMSTYLLAAGYDPDAFQQENYVNKNEGAAVAMMMVGVAGYLTSYIWSIVDAPKVAKIKNMYRRDLYDMTSVSLHLEPYFATTAGMTPAGNIPLAAGASLKIRF